MGRLGILFVRAYRLFLRPILRRRCIFSPTCSEYAIHALQEHAFIEAIGLIRRRLDSCRWPRTVSWTVDVDGRPVVLDVETRTTSSRALTPNSLESELSELGARSEMVPGRRRWRS